MMRDNVSPLNSY